MKRQFLEQETLMGGPKKKIKDTKFIPSIPQFSFKDFRGYNDIISMLSETIDLYKKIDIHKEVLPEPVKSGFLFYGPPNCGKSFLAECLAGELGWNLIRGSGSKDFPNASSIKDLFHSAITNAPSVLLLDNLDKLSVSRNGSVEMERDLLFQLCSSFEELKMEDRYKIIIVGTTRRLDSIHPKIHRGGMLGREVLLGLPNRSERCEIFKNLASSTDMFQELDIDALAAATPGYTVVELHRLLPDEIGRVQIRRRDKHMYENMKSEDALILRLRSFLHKEHKIERVGMDVVNEALQLIKPLSKKEGFIVDVPKVTWDHLGGSLREIRKTMEYYFIAQVKSPEVYSVLTDESSGGILLYGPPGCGKTSVAKALANEANFNFISVRGPEFLNMHVGESERAIREYFARARSNQPCIIFFDELDSICVGRSSSSEGYNDGSDRIVSQMLSEMDGMDEKKGVYVVAATNRPEAIDKALLRPERLGKQFYIGIPSPEDRVDILKTLTRVKNLPVKDVDFDALGKDPSLDGFTGADLDGLVYQASLIAVSERTKYVTMEIFSKAAQEMTPSVSPAERLRYEAIRTKMLNMRTN